MAKTKGSYQNIKKTSSFVPVKNDVVTINTQATAANSSEAVALEVVEEVIETLPEAKPASEEKKIAVVSESEEKPAAKKRGRKPGSKNKPKVTEEVATESKRRGRPKKSEEVPATETKKHTKKQEITTNICYQVPGKEINEEAIYDWIKYIWTTQLGRKLSDMKSISVYLKPSESHIYYVVNNDYAGKLDF